MTSRRFWVWAAAVAVLAGGLALAAGLAASSSRDAKPQESKFAKSDPDSGADKAGIPNEGPDGTVAAQEEANRAYPADSVPADAALNSLSTFSSLQKKGKGQGNWQTIGPTKATYPAVLDQFLFDGADYVASGRVTAMAIAPDCTKSHCTLYVGAAGGGVWKTDKALDGNPTWTYTSSAIGSNAIGSLLIDKSDPSGNIVYAATGEPNASGDSEAGVGIYKSTNGGDSWSLVPGSNIFCQRSIGQIALDNAGNLLVPIASGVRGVSSVTGGASSSSSSTCTLKTRGLWRQTGATFTLIWPSPPPVRGSTRVEVDPTHPGVIYVNAFQQGIWRSTDNGATFSRIFAPTDPTVAAFAIDRSEFDVTTLPSGATRMYVGEGAGGDPVQSSFWRSDNADTAATFAQMDFAQTHNYCTGQCWYDNYVVTPPGSPDVVYLGGSYSYGEQHRISNGRAVLLSTDGGSTFSDMTLDADPTHAEGIHPDQHALVTVPGNPLWFIEGSDGGVVRSDGRVADISYKCDQRGLSAADTTYCKSLLFRVPNQLISMNIGLTTLQFQSFSVDPHNPQNSLMGGTQDNGTFEYTGSDQKWPQIIYGDGGQSGWNAVDDHLRFNSFFGQNHDANFRNGLPTAWVIISGPIAASPEGSNFYAPIIADPNPAVAGTIFEGSRHVWRTQDWGGNQAYLEANCPEFTTPSDDPACGDFVTLAGPPGNNTPGDLAGTAYGADRTGGAVAATERAPSNTGTLWAATNAGRVFITDNADAPAASVVWTRLDTSATNDPPRFVSSIYVDPANPNHAWLSYTGYNINTPATPGHVFEVTRVGGVATWTDRTYNLADLPVTDLVRDDLTGDLYAATDFGVMKLANGTTSWTIAADGMPMVEVPGLTIVPSERVLYAATHGLGGWKLDLGKIK